MSGDAQMRRLCGVGGFTLYFAKPGEFVEPGFHLWTGKRHRRVLPLPRKERS